MGVLGKRGPQAPIKRRKEIYTVRSTGVLSWTGMNLVVPRSTQKVKESGACPERGIWQSMTEGSDFRVTKLYRVCPPITGKGHHRC